MGKKSESVYGNLLRDIFFILLSILFAILLVRFGVLSKIISSIEGIRVIDSFFAGIFFTSIFTVTPASVTLLELAKFMPITSVAFFGAAGAVVGDMILFLFIRDKFADDLEKVLHIYHDRKLTRFFHRKFFKWLSPVIGAVIIASPLPDEIGITMMGVSKINTSTLIAISFIMNFIGILLIAFTFGSL